MRDLGSLVPAFRLPTLHIPSITWGDVLTGVLVLAVPQAALTLGNAVIATAEEHNHLFPDRPVSVRLLAFDHAVMNLVAAPLGGVPMCRGAGGMAGHVRFGAHTGGALVILGVLLLTAALFLSDSMGTLFSLFPMPVLGVILFFGGIELAASTSGEALPRGERTIMVVTGNFFFAGAVEWTEAPVTVRDDNQVGVTTWETADTCDFDGDGIPDRFMTTGQTWWFSSNRGQGPWIYLNSSTLHVRDVALGYFDGDAICDVVAGGVTYSGGRTSPRRQVLRNSPAKARQLLSQ